MRDISSAVLPNADVKIYLDASAEERAKRRLNCFRGNMIDILVGGITLADRDNLKASVEDAVLNCRSASINGVGFGANFMALSVLDQMKDEPEYIGDTIVQILYKTYRELFTLLYEKSYSLIADMHSAASL